MVARPIHNLKVAGSNLEVGSIFSERYLARMGEEREKENWRWRNSEEGLRLRVGKSNIFCVILDFQPKTRKSTDKSCKISMVHSSN